MKNMLIALIMMVSLATMAQEKKKKTKWSHTSGPSYAVGGSFMATGTILTGYAYYKQRQLIYDPKFYDNRYIKNDRDFYGLSGGAMIFIGSIVFLTTFEDIGHKKVSIGTSCNGITLTIKI